MEKTVTIARFSTPVLVVIPYCSEGSQGNELEYAVAGWRRHFKENYLIVIAGEYHPITETGVDICCVESKRVAPIYGQNRQHLDYVSCLRKVRKMFPESDGFIFVGDDCYAVNDFDMSEVKLLKSLPDDIPEFYNPFCWWETDAHRTREVLLRDGFPIHNYTTHLPQWFEWSKLEALWNKYDMDNKSLVFESLYYNVYCKNRLPYRLNDGDNFKLGLYDDKADEEAIRAALGSKIWINNSPPGWTPALEKVLDGYYK